jgi:hypothetical protein
MLFTLNRLICPELDKELLRHYITFGILLLERFSTKNIIKLSFLFRSREMEIRILNSMKLDFYVKLGFLNRHQI